jgi:hypothetical protein
MTTPISTSIIIISLIKLYHYHSVIVVGDGSVGKTKLQRRFATG